MAEITRFVQEFPSLSGPYQTEPVPTSYSAAKLRRDVPAFHPVVALPAGMRQVFAAMEREGRIPRAESEGWEDALITWHLQQAHRRTREVATHDRRNVR
jgi:hypothetical protein